MSLKIFFLLLVVVSAISLPLDCKTGRVRQSQKCQFDGEKEMNNTRQALLGHGSCQGRCREKVHLPISNLRCTCDQSCLGRLTCCQDYDRVCTSGSVDSASDEVVDDNAPSQPGKTSSGYRCVHFGNAKRAAWVYSACPTKVLLPPQLRHLCEEDTSNIFSNIPVDSSSGVIYRNAFCAICNAADGVRPWSKISTCDHDPSFPLFKSSVPVTDIQSDQFIMYVHESCKLYEIVPPYPDELKDTCQPVRRVRSVSKRSNPSVGMSLAEVFKYLEKNGMSPVSFSVIMNFGFDGKKHLLFNSAHEIVTDTVKLCSKDEIYDPNKRHCRKVVCPKSYNLIDGKCVEEKYPTYKEYEYKPSPLSASLCGLSDGDYNVVMSEVFPEFFIAYFSSMLDINEARFVNFSRTPFFDEKQNFTVCVKISFVLMPELVNPARPLDADEPHSSDELDIADKIASRLEHSILYIEINDTILNLNVKDVVYQNSSLWCRYGIKRDYVNPDFDVILEHDPITNNTITKIYVKDIDTIYTPRQYDLTLLLHGRETWTNVSLNISGYVTVCEKIPRIADKSCGRIQLEATDYLMFRNRSFLYYNKLYSLDEYELNVNKTVEICIPNDYLNFTETKNNTLLLASCAPHFMDFASVETWASTILGSLSVAALLCTMVTYIVFRQLRNLPGISTMNLTVSVMVSQLMFLTGSGASSSFATCAAAAVTLHYLLLASFFWTNVMAFDIFRTFAAKKIVINISERRKYAARYMAYAWGCPALIVITCTLVDFTSITEHLNLKIGYGNGFQYNETQYRSLTNQKETLEDHCNGNLTECATFEKVKLLREMLHQQSLYCWINEPLATLIVFGCPVLIVLLVNITLFVQTIISIRRTAKMARNRTRRTSTSSSIATNESEVMLYVRMSSFMGFTWVIGLASSLLSAMFKEQTEGVCYVLHILSILFIIFNSSQGLFIFFAFTFNRRTKNLYVDLCKEKWSKFRNRNTLRLSYSTASILTVSTIKMDAGGDKCPGNSLQR